MIDSNADTLLQTEEFEELSVNLMREIIGRDSLSVRDETLVCQAIHRYGSAIISHQRHKV